MLRRHETAPRGVPGAFFRRGVLMHCPACEGQPVFGQRAGIVPGTPEGWRDVPCAICGGRGRAIDVTEAILNEPGIRREDLE